MTDQPNETAVEIPVEKPAEPKSIPLAPTFADLQRLAVWAATLPPGQDGAEWRRLAFSMLGKAERELMARNARQTKANAAN